MSINLGGVFVAMRSRDAQFRSSMRRSADAVRSQQRALKGLRRTVLRTNQRFRQFRSSVLSVRGAVGLVAGSGALGLLIKRQAEFGSTLIETSRQVNFSVERLQLLGRAFQGEGGNIESFNRGLRQFTRSIAEADRGVSTYAHQFKAMGVTLRNEQGQLRDSEEILLGMADGLQVLGSQAEKTNAVMTLFGARNIAFQNILQNGRKALVDQLESFRRLGVVASDEAQRLKDLNQSFSDLGNALQVGAAQGVAAAADQFRRFNETLIKIGPGAISTLIEATTRLVENLNVLGEIAAAGGIILGVRLVAQIRVAVAAVKGLSLSLAAARIGLAALSGPAGWLAVAGGAMAYFVLRTRHAETALKDLEFQIQRNQSGHVIGSSNDPLLQGLDRQIARAETAAEAQKSYRQALEETTSAIKSLEAESKRASAADLLGLNRRIDDLKRAQGEYLRSLRAGQGPLRPGETVTLDDRTPSARPRPRPVLSSGFAAEVRANIERENRLLSQKLDLLKVEGDLRTRLQAQFQVANQFAERGIVLESNKQRKSAQAAVLIAQDRLRAFERTRSQQDALTEQQLEQLKLAEKLSGIEARRQQQAAIRASVLEANLSNQQQLNGLLDEANRLEKSTAALREQLAGKTPAGDTVQAGLESRAVELARELFDAQARGDEAAQAALQAAIVKLAEYREALVQRNQAQAAFNDAQKQSLALTQAQAQVQDNTEAGFIKQVDLEIQRLKNANKLAKLKGLELFTAQQKIKLQERSDALLVASFKAKDEGNKAAAEALEAQAGELSRIINNKKVLNEEQKKLVQGVLAEREAQKKVNEEPKRRLEFAKKTAQLLSSGLEAAIVSGEKLSEVFKKIGQELLKVALRILVLRQIEVALTNVFAGGSGGNSAGSGVIGGNSAGRAGGGPVAAGQLTLVGEHGPELVRPLVPSVVIPNYKLRGAMAGGGGPSFHFHFNIESTDGPGVEAAIGRKLPEMMQKAAEVAEKVLEVKASRVSPLSRKFRRR